MGAVRETSQVWQLVHRLQMRGSLFPNPRLKSAIFFAGWPPVAIDQQDVRCVLADECDDVLDVPTLHVCGLQPFAFTGSSY